MSSLSPELRGMFRERLTMVCRTKGIWLAPAHNPVFRRLGTVILPQRRARDIPGRVRGLLSDRFQQGAGVIGPLELGVTLHRPSQLSSCRCIFAELLVGHPQ